MGPQGRSERVRKISAARGFDPQTFQPVASRYTDYAMLHMHFLFAPCVGYMSDLGLQLVHKVATGVNSDKHLPLKSANVRMASPFCRVRPLAVPIIPAENSRSMSKQ